MALAGCGATTSDLRPTVEALVAEQLEDIRGTPQPEIPTPDLVATIEAVVERSLAEFQTVATLQPTPTPILSENEASDLVWNRLISCLFDMKDSFTSIADANWMSDTSYLGGDEWLVEVWHLGLKGGGSLDLGRWRVLERTGEVLPYDGSARTFAGMACFVR